jgi:hypothetical protein
MTTHTTTFTVQIELAQTNTVNRLADGHLVFKGGPLDGCTLGGFTVWANKNGNGENVTFPARPYTNSKGDKRSFPSSRGSRRVCRSSATSSWRRTAKPSKRPRQTPNRRQRGAFGRPVLTLRDRAPSARFEPTNL